MSESKKRFKLDQIQNPGFIESLHTWLRIEDEGSLDYVRAYCLLSRTEDPDMKHAQVQFLDKNQSLDWRRTYAQQMIDLEKLKKPSESLLDRFIDKRSPCAVEMGKFAKAFHRKVEEEYFVNEGVRFSVFLRANNFLDRHSQPMLLDKYLQKHGFIYAGSDSINYNQYTIFFVAQADPPADSLAAQWKDHRFGTIEDVKKRKLYNQCLDHIELEIRGEFPPDIKDEYSPEIIEHVRERLIPEGFTLEVDAENDNAISVELVEETVFKRFMEMRGLL